MSNPTNYDWQRAKRVLRYLKGSRDLKLVYSSLTNEVEIYTDASYKDLKPSNKTTEGFIIKVFGDVISWAARKRRRRVTSTCEAEFRVLNEGIREMKCIQSTIKSVMRDYIYPVVAFCDSESAIKCTTVTSKPKLKHVIEEEEQLVRECVKYGEVRIMKIDTEDQLADICTKPLGLARFVKLRHELLHDEI
ncbi:unnamed protein product [Allacma fusca]|uniref:Uncharacterized protein n=1 Tax=Allacma fusca TaxID=39272 RepID=A0A8J2LF04_9HEXA|nr:unnamed protein product [Allacma fusca]